MIPTYLYKRKEKNEAAAAKKKKKKKSAKQTNIYTYLGDSNNILPQHCEPLNLPLLHLPPKPVTVVGLNADPHN